MHKLRSANRCMPLASKADCSVLFVESHFRESSLEPINVPSSFANEAMSSVLQNLPLNSGIVVLEKSSLGAMAHMWGAPETLAVAAKSGATNNRRQRLADGLMEVLDGGLAITSINLILLERQRVSKKLKVVRNSQFPSLSP